VTVPFDEFFWGFAHLAYATCRKRPREATPHLAARRPAPSSPAPTRRTYTPPGAAPLPADPHQRTSGGVGARVGAPARCPPPRRGAAWCCVDQDVGASLLRTPGAARWGAARRAGGRSLLLWVVCGCGGVLWRPWVYRPPLRCCSACRGAGRCSSAGAGAARCQVRPGAQRRRTHLHGCPLDDGSRRLDPRKVCRCHGRPSGVSGVVTFPPGVDDGRSGCGVVGVGAAGSAVRRGVRQPHVVPLVAPRGARSASAPRPHPAPSGPIGGATWVLAPYPTSLWAGRRACALAQQLATGVGAPGRVWPRRARGGRQGWRVWWAALGCVSWPAGAARDAAASGAGRVGVERRLHPRRGMAGSFRPFGSVMHCGGSRPRPHRPHPKDQKTYLDSPAMPAGCGRQPHCNFCHPPLICC
jgi:hypothetical protein